MVDKVIKTINLYPDRDRVLEDIKAFRQLKSETVSDEDIQKLFNKAAFVANKATYLMKAISEVANQYHIPIDQSRTDVVAAAQRRLGDSENGSKITFAAYASMIDVLYKQKLAMQEEATLQRLSVTGSTLSTRLAKIRKRIYIEANGSTVDDATLEQLVSQFIILYIASHLLRPFIAYFQDLPAWSTLGPEGEQAVGISTINLIVGLAVQFMIMKLNEEKMEEYLKLAAGDSVPPGFNFKGVIAQARELKSHPALSYADLYLVESDYEILAAYCFEFLASSSDPGYQFWIYYVDCSEQRFNAKNLWSYAPYYSSVHAVGNQTAKVKRPKKQLDLDLEDEFNLKESIKDGILNMRTSTYMMYNGYVDSSNELLDKVAQVLGSAVALESIICLSKFLKRIPEDTLLLIRSILVSLVQAYNFDIRDLISSIMSKLICPSVDELLAQALLVEIDKIFDKIISKVFSLFGEEVEQFMCCALLGEFLTRIMQIILKIKSMLQQAVEVFIRNAISVSPLSLNMASKRVETTYETRIIHNFIAIIDYVLKLNNYVGGDYTPDQVRKALAIPTLKVDDEIIAQYFSTATAKELINGKFLPKLGDQIYSLNVDFGFDAFNNLKEGHTCAKGFDEEQLNSLFFGDTSEPKGF